MSLPASRLLGPYRIVFPLGAGGMGEVYRARDSRLDRDVALKILPPEVAGSEDRRRRFEFEARSASALNHPNIVSVYDIGSDGDLFYIVSELVSGESLRSVVRQGAMSIRRLLEVAVQVAEGLSASHAAGILHRDLKPENIMIAKDGRVKILDFGLAKQIPSVGEGGLTHASTLTAAQQLVGTPGYMCPEQIRQQPLDVRSDIFSFGCVLYEMVTGRRAFSGPSAVEIMHATVAQDPAPLSSSSHRIPVALDRIVHRCLEKDPARRFQTASDLAFALQSAPESSASGTGPAPALPRSPHSRVVTRLPEKCRSRSGDPRRQGTSAGGQGAWGILALGPGQERERDLSWAEDNGYPRISADGRLVVFTCGGEGGGQPASVILRNTDGSPGLRLADGVSMGGISPDGKWVNIRPGVSPQKEILIPTGPGEEIDINLPGIGSATVVYWLPDGKSYIVAGNVPGKHDRYWYWQPSSGALRPLSHEVENARPSALKPDSTELVMRLDYRWISLPSGEARPFPGFEDGDRTLVWSADAKAIYFLPASQGPTSFSVWRLDLATRRRSFWKQITPSKSVDHINGLHLTPNGCCYVYGYDRTLSDLYLADGFR